MSRTDGTQVALGARARETLLLQEQTGCAMQRLVEIRYRQSACTSIGFASRRADGALYSRVQAQTCLQAIHFLDGQIPQLSAERYK